MKENEKEFPCIDHPQKKSSLSFYLVIFILLICSRFFDIYTTYLATPNLTKESNIMVRYLGLGWFNLIIMNLVIILVFFFLFRFSWSKFKKRYPNKWNRDNPSSRELNNDVRSPTNNKDIRSSSKHRNISLEIGMTLPIYVIITGYFQGIVNIMIHLKLIMFSFTSFLLLYPAIIGGVFGYISLHITKHILYLKHPRFTRKAHKIMMPKRTVEHKG
jgi:hypothetical protein